MGRRRGYGSVEATTYLYRLVETEDDCEEKEIEVRVEGDVCWGEAPSWGYYGGSPGSPDEAEIVQMWERVPVQGPPTKKTVDFYDKFRPHGSVYPIGVVEVEFDEKTLDRNEEDKIKEALLAAAREARDDAKVEAYLAARDYP